MKKTKLKSTKIRKKKEMKRGIFFKKSNFSAFFYVENSLQMIFDY